MRLNIILARYLFIFLLFAVFILLIFVPVYGYIADFTLRNELVHISNRMEQGISVLNSVLAALDLGIISDSRDSRFSVFRSWFFDPPDQFQLNNINPNTLLELQDSLRLKILPYSLPADTGILFPNGMAVTRNNISYYARPVSFYDSFLQCGDLTLEEWRGLLASGSSLLPAMPYTSVYFADYEAVTYTANWAYIGYPEKAIFFAALPVDGIVALLAETDVAQAAYIRMYNADRMLLFLWGSESGGLFHTVSGQSPNNSIRVEIGIPDSFIAGKLRPVKNLMLLFIGIAAVFVLILSFLFAWRSSLPESAFLARIRPVGIAHTGANVFYGFKRIFTDLADRISEEESQMDIFLRTIETQTALIHTQIIEPIRKALSCGDEARSITILRDCAAALPSPEDPLIAALLARMLSTMIRDLGEELSGIIPFIEVPEYESGSQQEIFERCYPDCFTRICESVRVHREKGISAQDRKILAYINEHLYDPNMYITMVTDHFNISAPTLQKLVKECTGQTFQNYLEKCRLDRARELLLNSSDNISQIAAACGFSSRESFSRSFKNIYGFPPSRLQDHAR